MSDSRPTKPRKGRSLLAELLIPDEDPPLWRRPFPAEGSNQLYSHIPGPLHSSFDPGLTIGVFLNGNVNDSLGSDEPLLGR